MSGSVVGRNLAVPQITVFFFLKQVSVWFGGSCRLGVVEMVDRS